MTIPKVVNKYKHIPENNDVYIGRPSKFGNPFVLDKSTCRDQVIAKYRGFLDQQIEMGNITKQDILNLEGKNLVCFCKPQKCHGDILVAKFLEIKKGDE
jgi:hypothetical protein